MKNHEYEVKFRDGEIITVFAGNCNEAKILAQAQRIKEGKAYGSIRSINEL